MLADVGTKGCNIAQVGLALCPLQRSQHSLSNFQLQALAYKLRKVRITNIIKVDILARWQILVFKSNGFNFVWRWWITVVWYEMIKIYLVVIAIFHWFAIDPQKLYGFFKHDLMEGVLLVYRTCCFHLGVNRMALLCSCKLFLSASGFAAWELSFISCRFSLLSLHPLTDRLIKQQHNLLKADVALSFGPDHLLGTFCTKQNKVDALASLG